MVTAPPIDAGEIDAPPPPADARVPVITGYEKAAMDDDEADERATDKTPVPPLPAQQKVPKLQPQNLCAVLAEVIAASPTFDALRSEEPPTATTDLEGLTTTIEDAGGKAHWLAVWPRRKRSTKVELGEVLPVLRGCPVLADYAGVRETIEATDAGSKDEIIWTRAGRPKVTLVDRFGDLKLRVEP